MNILITGSMEAMFKY